MGGNYRFAPASSAPALNLGGQLIVRCDGASPDGITLEARYLIQLGRGYDVTPNGASDHYGLTFDKEESVLTYVLTPYGIDTSLEFQNALVSNALVYTLTRARQSHLEKLAGGGQGPTEVRRGLDHIQGAELMAHLALLGKVHKEV